MTEICFGCTKMENFGEKTYFMSGKKSWKVTLPATPKKYSSYAPGQMSYEMAETRLKEQESMTDDMIHHLSNLLCFLKSLKTPGNK